MDGLHTIISSNIRFDNPGDGVLCWDMRQSLLTKILLSYQPLLIGTQEGRHSQHLELLHTLQGFHLCDKHRSWIDERMYPCLYLNKAQHSFNSSDWWLSETPEVAASRLPGSAFPRLCTWMKFQLSGYSIVVFNLHIDFLNSETRLRQCEILVAEIKRQTNENDRVILMGDFNDYPGSSVYHYLLEATGLYDPWTAAEEPSHHSFSGSAWEGHRIDWILLDKRLKCEEIFLDKTSEGQLWPSDHYPLVCRFRVS